MTNKELFERFNEALNHAATYWDITKCMPLEIRDRNQSLIYGVMLAALHTLPGEDYQKLVKKCHELGFNH